MPTSNSEPEGEADMTIRRATARDIPLIGRGLAALPNAPLLGEGDVERSIADHDFFYVDTVQKVFALVIPRRAEPDTYVAYWIWQGDLNPALHTPVLGAACRALRRAHPALGPAAIWGDFPGAGSTDATRKLDSNRQAKEHTSWMGAALSTTDSKNNIRMDEGRATLDAVIAGVAALKATP